jgi:aromatic-L-amino-acid decarboxylase
MLTKKGDSIDDLDAFNQRLHRRLIQENKYMPSTTKVNNTLALRPCFISARHEQEQAEGLVKAVVRVDDALVQELS